MTDEQWKAVEVITRDSGFDGVLSNPDTWKRYPIYREFAIREAADFQDDLEGTDQ